jgi:hypothetical protein
MGSCPAALIIMTTLKTTPKKVENKWLDNDSGKDNEVEVEEEG